MSQNAATECPTEILDALEDLTIEVAMLQHLMQAITRNADTMSDLPATMLDSKPSH